MAYSRYIFTLILQPVKMPILHQIVLSIGNICYTQGLNEHKVYAVQILCTSPINTKQSSASYVAPRMLGSKITTIHLEKGNHVVYSG